MKKPRVWTILRYVVRHKTCTSQLKKFGKIGEFASDYIEVRRDYTDWTPLYSGKAQADFETQAPPAAGDRHGVPDSQISRQHVDLPVGNGQPKPANGLTSISEKSEGDPVSSDQSSS